MMTKEELLRHNAAIKAARELEAKKKAELEGKREESAVEAAIIEEKIEEQPAPKKKRGGKKPANREYMVVDAVGIEEEAASEADSDAE